VDNVRLAVFRKCVKRQCVKQRVGGEDAHKNFNIYKDSLSSGLEW
jgi:hypothetical protein